MRIHSCQKWILKFIIFFVGCDERFDFKPRDRDNFTFFMFFSRNKDFQDFVAFFILFSTVFNRKSEVCWNVFLFSTQDIRSQVLSIQTFTTLVKHNDSIQIAPKLILTTFSSVLWWFQMIQNSVILTKRPSFRYSWQKWPNSFPGEAASSKYRHLSNSQ